MASNSSSNATTSTITQAQIDFAGVFAYASTIPGTVVCFLVLIAYASVATPKRSRECLDRVSFRLLVYSLFFNVFFGIAFAATPTAPGTGCEVGAFFVNLTLSFATFFTTSIAINLELVLVHDVDGKNMEKYYVIGTTILSLALNVPAVALRQFGWNDVTCTCWYGNPDQEARLRWIIGTQSFWITLAATIETVCSVIVLSWLFLFKMSIKSFMKEAQSSNPINSGGSAEGTAATGCGTRPLTRPQENPSSMITDDPRFRKIILRIAMYPIISLIMNYGTVVLDLKFSIKGVNTQYDYRLLVLDLTLYGLRTLAYGMIAASDPAFVNAARVVYRSTRTQVTSQSQYVTQIDFAPGRSQDRSGGADENSVDGQRTVLSGIEVQALDEEEGQRESGWRQHALEMRNFERQL